MTDRQLLERDAAVDKKIEEIEIAFYNKEKVIYNTTALFLILSTVILKFEFVFYSFLMSVSVTILIYFFNIKDIIKEQSFIRTELYSVFFGIYIGTLLGQYIIQYVDWSLLEFVYLLIYILISLVFNVLIKLLMTETILIPKSRTVIEELARAKGMELVEFTERILKMMEKDKD